MRSVFLRALHLNWNPVSAIVQAFAKIRPLSITFLQCISTKISIYSNLKILSKVIAKKRHFQRSWAYFNLSSL